jgi:hypothetical protein
MLSRHFITSRVHQHDEHIHPKPLAKRMKGKKLEPNGRPKILMSLIGQQRFGGKVNPRGKPKGAQVEHL